MRLSRRIWELRNLPTQAALGAEESRSLLENSCGRIRYSVFYATPSGGWGWVLLACSSVTSSLPSARKLRGIS